MASESLEVALREQTFEEQADVLLHRCGEVRDYHEVLAGFRDRTVVGKGCSMTPEDLRTVEAFLRVQGSSLESPDTERARSARRQVAILLIACARGDTCLFVKDAYDLCPLVGKLTLLEVFVLSGHSQISVRLPSTLGDLSNLRRMQLSGNRLSSLPVEVWGLKQLKWLDISQNEFVELSPGIGNLERLTHLDVGYNKIGRLPPEVGYLKELYCLDAKHNGLVELPEELWDTEKLWELRVDNNELCRLSPRVGNSKKLFCLNVSHNQLVELPEELWNVETLRTLKVNNNGLCRLSPQIGNAKKLFCLDVSHNQLVGLPEELWNVETLRTLKVNNNGLCRWSGSVGSRSFLRELRIHDNRLRVFPGKVTMPRLESLDASRNRITKLSEELWESKQLRHLDVSCNQLAELSERLGDLEKLVDLCVGNNRLRRLPGSIGNLGSLLKLHVYDNRLSTLPDEMANLSLLEELDVSYNRLKDYPRVVLSLPMPCVARVQCSDNPFILQPGVQLEVDPDDIDGNPFEVLSRLPLCPDRPSLPAIRYKGSRSTDGGGVIRDLITRLFLAMFPEQGGGPKSALTRESCLSIGRLFGAAFLNESGVVTGNRFGPSFFRKIGRALIDLSSEDSPPPTKRRKADESEAASCDELPDCPDHIVRSVAERVHDIDLSSEGSPPPAGRRKRDESEVASSGELPDYPDHIVRLIAEGMYDYVGEESRRDLLEQVERGELQSTIEGTLSPGRVLEVLRTDDPTLEVYGYLTRWVRESDDNTLGDFLQCVTGLRTLPPCDSPVYVEIVDATKGLPFFHVCAQQIDLPDYGKHEGGYRYCADRLAFATEHALAGKIWE
ncbi:MAG: hypothetical protein OXF02_04640 [Simkaniaceae bacterium]|nr:hypothetical protein [Simkaniaceae bacterium]